MCAKPQRPGCKDKLLFTPGPLTTSRTVKQAMLKNFGSRDREFIDLVKELRHKYVDLYAQVKQERSRIQFNYK